MKNLKYLIIVGILLILASGAYSQDSIDYVRLRTEIKHFSCTSTNLDSIQITLKELLEIDTSKITNGLYYYYKDLGMTYYLLGANNNRSDNFSHSIICFNKCISIDRKNPIAYNNLYIIYTLLGKKQLAEENFDLYQQYLEENK